MLKITTISGTKVSLVQYAWVDVVLILGANMRFVFLTALLSAALASAQVASHAPSMPVTTAPATTPVSTGAHGGTAASPVSTASMQVSGKPVARVNGSVLTDRDLLREMLAMFPYARVHNGFPKGQEPEIRRGALAMIEYEELVYQEAERRKMTIPAARLKKAENGYRNKFQSDDDFEQYLKTELNGDRKVFRQQIRRSMLIEALLKAEVGDKSKVSLAEARAYYDKNPKLFHHAELFAFQTISIMPAEDSSAEVKQKAKERAQDALKQAKATKTSEQFGLLAEKVSEDDYRVNMGDHKLVEREKLPPDMLKQALAMQPGQISNLIQVGSFYFFFRLNAHVAAGKVAFAEVKDRLLTDLQKTKYDQLRGDLDKRLRQHAKVEEV
jgi:parvulin-like peptidyl-prolyl isomerase